MLNLNIKRSYNGGYSIFRLGLGKKCDDVSSVAGMGEP